MTMSFLRRLTYFLIAFLTAIPSFAQQTEQNDSIVRLVKGESVQLIEQFGRVYRKVVGNPATFFHNNTYLNCDTAMWDVDLRVIYGIGHVEIIQDRTVLQSDKLDYYIDQDLAQFRGGVVQLRDKDKNTLRTRYLDFNTKDSVGVFHNGGSMKDKDGQIIESLNGTYDSKIKLFTFVDNVNMFTDSIFVKTTRLSYHSTPGVAEFGRGTNAWRDDNMLSSDAGWYNRPKEVFLFNGNVHVLTKDQEGWSDSLYYYRTPNDVEMLGNAQVVDSLHDAGALGGRLFYQDTVSTVTMTRKPAIVMKTKSGDQVDTVYFGADSLIYKTIKKCDIDSSVVAAAKKRTDDLSGDPVSEYRRKAASAAAEEAKKAADEAAEASRGGAPRKGRIPNRGNAGGPQSSQNAQSPQTPPKQEQTAPPKSDHNAPPKQDQIAPPASDLAAPPKPDAVSEMAKDSLGIGPEKPPVAGDSTAMAPDDISPDGLGTNNLGLSAAHDSLGGKTPAMSIKNPALSAKTDSLSAKQDSLSVAKDTAVIAKDTSKLGFLTALRNVKVFRKDMQVVCDSLEYCDLDSLARLFKKPVVWNEVKRQYTADSIYVVVRNKAVDRANLMSNAFIITQEDSICFDQIKSTEVVAYFDSTGTLKRFDALGDASAIFYLKEHDALATVNKVTSKMLYAEFKNGDVERIYYFDAAKNDAYPTVQLSEKDRVLKGFDWQSKARPKSKDDITPIVFRSSERSQYLSRPKTTFKETDTYFPGYMKGVYKSLAKADSLKNARRIARELAKSQARIDSLNAEDSLKVRDLLAGRDSLSAKDSLNASDHLNVSSDSLKVPSDSLKMTGDSLNVSSDSLQANQDTLSKAYLKAKAQAEKQKKKEAKIARRDTLIASILKKDKDKEKLKADKKLAKQRKNTARLVIQERQTEAKQAAKIARFKARFEKRKARLDARKAKKVKITPDSTIVETKNVKDSILVKTKKLPDTTLVKPGKKIDKFEAKPIVQQSEKPIGQTTLLYSKPLQRPSQYSEEAQIPFFRGNSDRLRTS